MRACQPSRSLSAASPRGAASRPSTPRGTRAATVGWSSYPGGSSVRRGRRANTRDPSREPPPSSAARTSIRTSPSSASTRPRVSSRRWARGSTSGSTRGSATPWSTTRSRRRGRSLTGSSPDEGHADPRRRGAERSAERPGLSPHVALREQDAVRFGVQPLERRGQDLRLDPAPLLGVHQVADRRLDPRVGARAEEDGRLLAHLELVHRGLRQHLPEGPYALPHRFTDRLVRHFLESAGHEGEVAFVRDLKAQLVPYVREQRPRVAEHRLAEDERVRELDHPAAGVIGREVLAPELPQRGVEISHVDDVPRRVADPYPVADPVRSADQDVQPAYEAEDGGLEGEAEDQRQDAERHERRVPAGRQDGGHDEEDDERSSGAHHAPQRVLRDPALEPAQDEGVHGLDHGEDRDDRHAPQRQPSKERFDPGGERNDFEPQEVVDHREAAEDEQVRRHPRELERTDRLLRRFRRRDLLERDADVLALLDFLYRFFARLSHAWIVAGGPVGGNRMRGQKGGGNKSAPPAAASEALGLPWESSSRASGRWKPGDPSGRSGLRTRPPGPLPAS